MKKIITITKNYFSILAAILSNFAIVLLYYKITNFVPETWYKFMIIIYLLLSLALSFIVLILVLLPISYILKVKYNNLPLFILSFFILLLNFISTEIWIVKDKIYIYVLYYVVWFLLYWLYLEFVKKWKKK
jgi:hypothetical protein